MFKTWVSSRILFLERRFQGLTLPTFSPTLLCRLASGSWHWRSVGEGGVRALWVFLRTSNETPKKTFPGTFGDERKPDPSPVAPTFTLPLGCPWVCTFRCSSLLLITLFLCFRFRWKDWKGSLTFQLSLVPHSDLCSCFDNWVLAQEAASTYMPSLVTIPWAWGLSTVLRLWNHRDWGPGASLVAQW